VTEVALLVRQFRSPIILILLLAAALSMVLGEMIDAAIVIAIVMVSGILGYYQERGAVRAIKALASSVRVHADVLRDGRECEIDISHVVSGDVVLLRVGDIVPGDGRILSANQLFLNEAVLTGENYPRNKSVGQVGIDTRIAQRTNCVYFGTHVASGEGTVVLVATGKETEFGQVAEHIAQQHVPTSFERGITSFGYLLMQATALLVSAIFIFNLVLHRSVIDSLLFSLALTVGLTPQMLPAIITLSLSRGAIVMAKQQVIVKRLDAIEDVGSLDVLCTDKTGTLTVGSVGLSSAVDTGGRISEYVRTLAWLNASLQSGFLNPMDSAITQSGTPANSDRCLFGELPFDFHRKRLSVLVGDSEGFLLITKGAVESILSCCSYALDADDQVVSLEEVMPQLRKLYESWSANGLRVLAVAKRILTTDENFSVTSESQMTLIGFLTFADPPKTGTRESLKMLHDLGVSVRIVTGDNALAAAHIAKAIGIGIEGLLTGADVSAMTDGELQSAIETVYVFAETDPIDKERIVAAFSRNGHTVGFLGDGINDTPALHAADVGISVDTAVDVAKQSADLVLLNKDLTVLASGIEEGRRVFVNTLKYVNVTTSANFGNMLSLALASVFLPFLPLLPFQILLLNFLSDIPGMTIATDRVDAEQLRYPHHWDMARVRKFMIVFGLVSTMFDLMTFAILRSVFHADATLLRSGWFIESTLTELAVMLVLRTRRTWWRSRPSNGLLAASIAVAGATLILLYSPLRSNLSLEGPPIRVLAAMMAITALYVVTTETLKKKMPGVLFTHEEPPR
jgi:Mg2+-importing ATPase